MAIGRTGSGRPLYSGSKYTATEDTAFVTGDSPVVYDINGLIGHNGGDGWISNDGLGDITVAVSNDGQTYGDEIRIKGGSALGSSNGEIFSLTGLAMWKIRITWVADTSYRLFII